MSNNPKKVLYQELKNKLNSPEYVAMPDLITYDDHYGKMLNFVFGWLVHGNVHSENKDNFIGDGSREKGDRTIYEHQFEPNDWEEIVNLIEKRNQEKQKIWETKRKNIEQKLNQQPGNLYYYWGKVRKNERADGWHENKGMRGFATFLGGNGNGLTHHLYIAEEHSVLDNFSFQTGFYLIDNDKKAEKCVGHYEGGFNSSGGETNPHNWKKYVEADDQITITPHEVKNNPVEKPNRDKSNNNFQPTKKNLSLSDNSSFNSTNQEEINEDYLKKLFSQNSINSISINKEGSLDIEYQDQKEEKNINNLSLQKYLIQNGQKKLSYSQLFNSNPSSPSNDKSPSSWTPYLIGGGILITLLTATVAYYLGRRKGKSE